MFDQLPSMFVGRRLLLSFSGHERAKIGRFVGTVADRQT